MAIKKIQNNFTTPEQSKLLLELGVPKNSADCYYETFDSHDPNDFRLEVRQNPKELSNSLFNDYRRLIPCWSAGRLMEIYRILANCGCCIQYNDDIIKTLIWDIKAGMFDEHDFSKLEE